MQRNKLISALVSIVIAFSLWLYVITVDSPDYTDTIYDIPLTFVGETALQSRNLVLTGISADSVDITFSGKRSDVLKLNKSNITLKVDLSRIYDPGVQTVEWTYAYPGDVASNAFTREAVNPDKVTVTIENWVRKEIAVRVNPVGVVPMGVFADTENVIQEFETITVAGPASAVDLVAEAIIDIDLSKYRESIGEYFRFTLVNPEGEPVDAARIEVSVDEVYVEMAIQSVKDVPLVIQLVDGGGATADTSVLYYEPQTIKVAGPESVLEELDEILLGTIHLADELQDREIVYPIPELEGITNLSGLTEVTAYLSFPNLLMKEFVVENLTAVNVPEGLEAEIITQKLTITVRGGADLVNRLTADQIKATVDFTDTQIGSSSFKVNIGFADGFESLGTVGVSTATATVSEVEKE